MWGSLGLDVGRRRAERKSDDVGVDSADLLPSEVFCLLGAPAPDVHRYLDHFRLTFSDVSDFYSKRRVRLQLKVNEALLQFAPKNDPIAKVLSGELVSELVSVTI